MSSEVAIKKNKNLLTNFFNLLNTLLVKHGKKKLNLVKLANFLFMLKNDEDTNDLNHQTNFSKSPFSKFYLFVSKCTPRVDVVSVENKRAAKVFKTPMPPSKNNLLQHNLIVKYVVTTSKNEQNFKDLPTNLFKTYKDLVTKRKGLIAQELDASYDILKQHKFRAKKRHDKIVKQRKNKNAIKKSKLFYL